MYALVDCNNFYASCERVFQPRLRERPVVVLSNNDGCVIARSEEAKDLGIPMGAHYHEWQSAFRRQGVIVRSSNYPLYGDLSQRIMDTLKDFSPRMEVYSIDESFLSLHHVEPATLPRYGQLIRTTIDRHIGMPVGVGIAPTKTLAKVANKLSKQHSGLCILNGKDQIESVLATFPVKKVWGIGGRYARFLQKHEITTALDLCQAKDAWIQQHLTIVGLRTVMELRGTPCLNLEEVAPRKQVVAVSRTFRNAVKDATALGEAIATYAARAGEKLRTQQCGCTIIKVHVATNIYQDGLSQYANSATVALALPTDYTPRLVKAAQQGLRTIYRPGYAYKIAGVQLMGLVEEDAGNQLDLFDAPTPVPARSLMKTMDSINAEHGRGTLKLAAEGGTQPWRMRQKHLSPRYTTRWGEVLQVRA